MRELNLNGYIDDESWFGDEITPESLHDLLYGAEDTLPEDVHIRLNSYGGSCNAAVRMFDDIRAYPGNVKITISGTAASAATVLAMAADRLEMTPGSLFMIHDPSTMAYGNERDLDGTRVRISREDAADMMTATSWMDANEAFNKGFVDGITEVPDKVPTDSMERKVSIDTAKAGVQAWFDRKTKPFFMEWKPDGLRNSAQPEEPSSEPVPDNRVPILQTDTRLEHLRY